jgi:hypothetical protein
MTILEMRFEIDELGYIWNLEFEREHVYTFIMSILGSCEVIFILEILFGNPWTLMFYFNNFILIFFGLGNHV